jgi:hypothetical protein
LVCFAEADTPRIRVLCPPEPPPASTAPYTMRERERERESGFIEGGGGEGASTFMVGGGVSSSTIEDGRRGGSVTSGHDSCASTIVAGMYHVDRWGGGGAVRAHAAVD